MSRKPAAGPARRRATKTPAKGRLVLKDAPDNSRLFVYLIGNFLHRLEVERRQVYFGDLDLARVAEIIGMAGVEPGMRDEDFRDTHRSFDSVVGVEDQRAVNASSISQATGIPRETVRRKLKVLLEQGLIVGKGRAGYVLRPGMMQAPERQASFAWGIQQTMQFMNDCLEQGLIDWAPADTKAC
jgi:predicted transcriptional regulator